MPYCFRLQVSPNIYSFELPELFSASNKTAHLTPQPLGKLTASLFISPYYISYGMHYQSTLALPLGFQSRNTMIQLTRKKLTRFTPHGRCFTSFIVFAAMRPFYF
jgi:hypothetical protein